MSKQVFLYFNATLGTSDVIVDTEYSVSTTPAHHRNFVPHSFLSTYCRKIDKKNR